jgi:hypothetical protein
MTSEPEFLLFTFGADGRSTEVLAAVPSGQPAVVAMEAFMERAGGDPFSPIEERLIELVETGDVEPLTWEVSTIAIISASEREQDHAHLPVIRPLT